MFVSVLVQYIAILYLAGVVHMQAHSLIVLLLVLLQLILPTLVLYLHGQMDQVGVHGVKGLCRKI